MIVQTQQLTPSAEQPSARMGTTAATATASVGVAGLLIALALPIAMSVGLSYWGASMALRKHEARSKA